MNRAQQLLLQIIENRPDVRDHPIHDNPWIRSRIRDQWTRRKIHPRWTYLKTHKTLKKPFEKEKRSEKTKKIYQQDLIARNKISRKLKGN